MTVTDTAPLSGTSALVTGASRGFGRATAAALVQAGATVAGVARGGGQLAEVREELGPVSCRSWPTRRTRCPPRGCWTSSGPRSWS